MDAALWMREQILEKSKLRQRDAAEFLLQFEDRRLAYVNDTDSPCVGRHVLKRFRRSFPDLGYDRRTKSWRLRADQIVPPTSDGVRPSGSRAAV
ncbi:DUF6953 family protein [Sphingosinicella terrae]|jgi:hypothetical protein|uniref:DUF6953 family protein n=1 Tax=Sphingosinicella terrae TaxID=2172047 RepID=UPI000E0CC51D